MRVLCIGDSLGMPRPGVDYSDTWFYKLSKEYDGVDFVYGFVRALSSDSLKHPDFCENYLPDVIICQLGIVDCSPRIINEKKWFWSSIINTVNRVRGGERVFWWLVKKFFKRNNPRRVFVTLNSFKKNLENYVLESIRSYGVKKIIFIKIATPHRKLRSTSPYMEENVKLYNNVFDELKKEYPNTIEVVDSLCIQEESIFVEDGYHVNGGGNLLVFKDLKRILNGIAK